MLVNGFVVAVVFQKIHAVLDDDGGNQAVHGISDGDAFAPQFTVNRRAQFKSGTVVGKIN
jgi:hypothetical protein